MIPKSILMAFHEVRMSPLLTRPHRLIHADSGSNSKHFDSGVRNYKYFISE